MLPAAEDEGMEFIDEEDFNWYDIFDWDNELPYDDPQLLYNEAELLIGKLFL